MSASPFAVSGLGRRAKGPRGALPFLLLIALIHLVLAWPGAAARGIIAEEIQPYLLHYPKVFGVRDEAVRLLPPYDDPRLLAAVEEGREVEPRWVGTPQWPEVGYHGKSRILPVFIRGHQTAIGSLWGIAAGPLLGEGIVGVRRSSVLMGLVLLVLVFAVARRLGLSRGWATLAAVGCAASPGLWFFARTGLAFEHASRVFMLLAIWVAAERVPLSRRRSVAVGAAIAVAILCRATVAATLAPVLILMLLDPRRRAPWLRLGGTLALGFGLPVVLASLGLALLPFASGQAPAADLAVHQLAARTLMAPLVAVHQLAWVADPRVILQPLADGGALPSAGLVRPLLGGLVAVAALVRWWGARAGEAERMFVCGLLGNALIGAWLYGDPLQFQLGMALEPLFVLALVHQLAALYRARGRASGAVTATGGAAAGVSGGGSSVGIFARRVSVGWAPVALALAAGLLCARALTLGSLWASERRTDNPMLSGRAQRELVSELRASAVRGDELLTTTYNHVGVVEGWTGERLRPVHAWRLLRSDSAAGADMVAKWKRALEARPACFVLLTVAATLYAGPFTAEREVAEALEPAALALGRRIERRHSIAGDGGGAVFELVELAPCERGESRSP